MNGSGDAQPLGGRPAPPAATESDGPAMGSVLCETHTTLSVVAGRTTNVRLGYSVMPTPYRHPLFQAKSLATLDQFSGGRVIYGGAAGHMVDEFHALGADFTCSNMTSDAKPVQKPHPPIWLGGDSDGAFRRIARFADGWHGLLGGSPGARREEPTIAHFAARIQRLHQIAETEGRDPGQYHPVDQVGLPDRRG